MDSTDDPSDNVGNETIFAKDSDEASVTMDSTESSTTGQFQKKISLSICSESGTSSDMDDNLSEEVEEPNAAFTSGLFCNSENKMHTPTDNEARALKHGIALPEYLSLGRNNKRALTIDDNEVEEDAKEGKRPTAKKIRTDDRSECMADEDEIMEECEESQNSAKDHDNEVKGDDAEGEEKPTAMNDRTDNESGCMTAEDEIIVEKNESLQNIDEQSLHLPKDHHTEVEEDAEEEQNHTTKENGTDNQSGYVAAADEIMEERYEFMQNTGKESQYSTKDHYNEVKRDDAEEQQKLTANENRIADESGYMTAEDEFMEEENASIKIIDEDSLHSAEDREEDMSITDYDENEDDLDYDKGEDDLEDDDGDKGEDNLERFEVTHNVPLNEVDILDPLTDEEEIVVKLALSEKYSNEVLVEHPNIDEDITGKLLECLRPEHQLNSDIFVPIYDSGAHWVVITIDIKRKRIQYLNSILSGMNHQAISRIAGYIEAEAKQRSGIDLDSDSWEKEAPANIPRQENDLLHRNDGGVFMLKYIDYISRDLPLDFNQEDIPLFRKKILIEILNMPGASSKIDLGWQYDDENATDNSNKLSIERLLEPLNEVEKVRVQFALWEKYRDVVLIKHPNVSESITGGLLQCLKPNQWLSSDVSRIKKAIEKIQTVYYDSFSSIFV